VNDLINMIDKIIFFTNEIIVKTTLILNIINLFCVINKFIFILIDEIIKVSIILKSKLK